MCDEQLSNLRKTLKLEKDFESPSTEFEINKTILDKERVVVENNDSSASEIEEENLRQSSLSILSSSEDFVKVDKKVLFEISNKKDKFVSREVKESCKLLSFSSELSVDDILSTIDRLDRREYPNLFIFIIHVKNIQFRKINKRKKVRRNKIANNFKDAVSKFSESRPLILQITSEYEQITKFYYKIENSTQFLTIDQYQKDFDKFKNFPTFLCSFLEKKTLNFDSELIKILLSAEELSLILRFLRTLNLNEDFWLNIIFEISKNRTETELLAAVGASFEGRGRMFINKSETYFASVFNKFPTLNEQSLEICRFHQELRQNSTISTLSQQASDENQNFDNLEKTSILHTAVEYNNIEIINYLISHCTHLIQQLPYTQQFKISTAAFSANQLDILCDLLEICDFPFPENYNFDDGTIVHEQLRKITKERIEFGRAIILGNFQQIDEFFDQNSSLRIVYNPINKSAIKHAVDLKQFQVYFYLKSLGFKATEFDHLKDILNATELKEANQFLGQQRRKNVTYALSDGQNLINLMCIKSFIHNRKINKEQELEYRKKIRKWYEDIYKVKFGAELLNVVASCEELKVIFDFESLSVENASLSGADSLGSTYPKLKWIFIGAKLNDKKREQQIKGVLAHELCHYFMRLVYENQDNPYYKHKTEIAEMFEEIVKIIDKWSSNESDGPDDECNGTISTVFKLYYKEEFHLELIVRVVQILVEFDDDEEKLNLLKERYKMLFVFWELYILPDAINFDLQGREDVRRVNRMFDVLPRIREENLKFTVKKDIKEIICDRLVLAISNVPQLLMINIHSYLDENFGNLFDTQNLFIDPEKLNNQEILNNFSQILIKHSKLRIFLDCAKKVPENVKKIIESANASNLVFVVPSEDQRDQILQFMKNIPKNLVKIEINYTWCDLTEESKQELLEAKVNFQNNSQFSLNDLLKVEKKFQSSLNSVDIKTKIDKYFSDIIDCQLLNQLVNRSEIIINVIDESSGIDRNFEFLFQTRKFIDRFSVKIFQDKLLKEVKDKKYVLISDIAGNGKTWIMKNFAFELTKQNPKNWVSYVELKQHIEDFKTQKTKPKFFDFFSEKIFKPKFNYEAKIFSKLYKSGKVFILFDGFDEIAPNCAEFVLQLAESFESNGGNQLWISTRDYFKVDILKKLKLDAVYKLDEFTKENGIELVVSSWILMDLSSTIKFKSREEFEKYCKNSPNYKIYERKARLIVQKVAMSEYRSVGLPQLYKMIAGSFKDDNDPTTNLKGSKIYRKFAQNLYKRWSDDKGLLQKKKSIESLEYDVNFWTFHQYFALEKLFHEFMKALFPNFDRSEWSDAEIVACGLMSKRGETFYFLHETFREFFASDFIAKALKKLKIVEKSSTAMAFARLFKKRERNDYIIELIVIILTTREYGTLLMFLDDAIDEYSILEKIQPFVQKSIKKFYEMENFCEFFTKNLKNLTTFLIAILKTGDYAEVKKLVTFNAIKIIENTNDSKSFFMFQEFVFEFFKVGDFKQFIMEEAVIQAIFMSNLEIETFKDFVLKTERITDTEFVREALKLSNDKLLEGNIFYLLGCSLKIDIHKIQLFLKIMQKFFKIPEIFELIKSCNNQEQNIFKFYIQTQNIENFKILWTELKSFFDSHNFSQYFKDILQHNNTSGCNILHFIAKCDQVEFYEIFWNLLLTTFEDREEFKNFIIQRSKVGDNSFHELIQSNKNSEIIELTFDIYKRHFSDVQFQEILKSVGRLELNLLQSAAYESNVVNHHRFLWRIFQNSLNSDQNFLKILEEVDMFGRNVLNIAAANSSDEVFEFLLKELEKIAPQHVIRKMLSNLDNSRRNIMQSAVMHNKFSKLHEYLWKILRKYFSESEILELIKHVDKDGDNLILIAVGSNRRDIIELTWKEIKNFMDHDEQIEYLKMKGYNNKNLLEKSVNNFRYKKEAHEWVQSLMHSCLHFFKEIVEQNDSDICGILHWTAECDKVEFHRTLWEVLFKKVNDREELINIIIHKNFLGDTFIHKLIQNSKDSVIIELTFQKFKHEFTDTQIQRILEAKGRWNMTLLQTAAFESNVLKFHQMLWKIFQDSFKSNEEFLKVIQEVDLQGRNILNIFVLHSSIEVFYFFIKELQKVAPSNVIKEMLRNIDKNNRNVLQSAANSNTSLEFHKFLWRILGQYFELSEIIIFIKHIDQLGNNVLFVAVKNNNKRVAELIWREIKCFLNENEQIEYLKAKGWKGKSLVEYSLDNWIDGREIHEWVQNLMFSVKQEQNVKFNDNVEFIDDDQNSFY